MGSIHTTLSSGGSLQPPLVIFCHQSSAIFSLRLSSPSSPPPSFFFLLFLPTLCLRLGPPVCTVDFWSFPSVEPFRNCQTCRLLRIQIQCRIIFDHVSTYCKWCCQYLCVNIASIYFTWMLPDRELDLQSPPY